jgi:hypothetical protein
VSQAASLLFELGAQFSPFNPLTPFRAKAAELVSGAFTTKPSSHLCLRDMNHICQQGRDEVCTSVDWALSIDVLPSLENAGEGLGFWNASMTLPAILAPLLGNLIINITDRYGQAEALWQFITGR